MKLNHKQTLAIDKWEDLQTNEIESVNIRKNSSPNRIEIKKKEIKNIIKKNNKFSDDEKINGDFEKYSDKEILEFWNKTDKKYEDYLTILDLAVPRTLVEVEKIIDKKRKSQAPLELLVLIEQSNNLRGFVREKKTVVGCNGSPGCSVHGGRRLRRRGRRQKSAG